MTEETREQTLAALTASMLPSKRHLLTQVLTVAAANAGGVEELLAGVDAVTAATVRSLVGDVGTDPARLERRRTWPVSLGIDVEEALYGAGLAAVRDRAHEDLAHERRRIELWLVEAGTRDGLIEVLAELEEPDRRDVWRDALAIGRTMLPELVDAERGVQIVSEAVDSLWVADVQEYRASLHAAARAALVERGVRVRVAVDAVPAPGDRLSREIAREATACAKVPGLGRGGQPGLAAGGAHPSLRDASALYIERARRSAGLPPRLTLIRGGADEPA